MTAPMIVVLAAGLGSRYGGIKQMAPVGARGEWLLDFSLYDAWQAGFRKVLFIIRPELQSSFEETIGARLAPYFDVTYVGQTIEHDTLMPIDLSKRNKPLGTAHALLCAKYEISGPFVVINADDYYGPEAYELLYQKLMHLSEASEAAMVAFSLKDTLSKYGTVARGLCKTNEENRLISVSERNGLVRCNDVIMDEFGTEMIPDARVSMNIWGLQPSCFELIEKEFENFKKTLLKSNPLLAEFYLPTCLNAGLVDKTINIEVLSTTGQWLGMTYLEDHESAAQRLRKLQREGIYPQELWQVNTGFEPILDAYSAIKQVESVEPITRGHINSTYKVQAKTALDEANFVLQKINTQVFTNPVGLMTNIESVTKYMADLGVRTLELMETSCDSAYFIDKAGQYWRLYKYVENSVVPSEQADLEELFAAGEAFGHFQYALRDFPVHTLDVVIPNFHHTPKRFLQLSQAITENPFGRAQWAYEEIAFATSLEPELDRIIKQLDAGTIPLRVTHNDTKVNNVLLSANSGKGLCVIDLDTVMPGSLLYDYGDGIRSSVTGVAEDEENLDLIQVDFHRFEAFTAGFLNGLEGMLTPVEAEQLLWGAILMSYECGMRFLTDYLMGDVYFKVKKTEHNLLRAKAQLKLAKELMTYQEELEQIINRCLIRGGAIK